MTNPKEIPSPCTAPGYPSREQTFDKIDNHCEEIIQALKLLNLKVDRCTEEIVSLQWHVLTDTEDDEV